MACGCKNRTKLSVKIIETTILVIVLCIIVALVSLPIVFYYVSDYTNFLAASPNSFYSNRSNGSNNNITNGLNPFKNSCTTLPITWSGLSININSTYCNDNPYVGTICRDILTAWHLCTIEDGDIVIYSNKSQQIQTQYKRNLLKLDSLLVHYKECRKVAIPFLCQYYFPLYDCPNGDIYTASREDCIDISTGVCGLQWNLAINYGYGDRLPNCQKLSSYTGNGSFINTFLNTTLQNITCRDDFIKINNTCHPRCDRFKQGTYDGSQLLIYSELIASIVALLLCILIVTISIKNYKSMFSYPSILLIFVVIDCSVMALLVIIISIDRNGLLCSSTSLIDSLNNPTPFCTLSGAVFHYAIVNMMLFWFFHVIIFFYKVVFPFHANRMEKLGRNKHILAVMIFLGLVIPLPAVIVSLSMEDYKYNIHHFPPNICISDGPMSFYSITIIIDVLVGIVTCLLFVVFWIIHKNPTFRSKSIKNKRQLSTAEKKILIAIYLFLVFAVFTLIHSAIVTAKSDKFIAAVTDYFKCEALGHVPGKCNRSEFEHYYNPYMSAISYFLLGLMPLGILNFVLKWRSVKEVTVKSIRRLSRKSSEMTNVSSSSSDNKV